VKWWRNRCYQTFTAGLPSAAIRLCPGRHVRKLWFSSRQSFMHVLCGARFITARRAIVGPVLFAANYSDQIPLIR
jgi:hypothetical protein